MPYWFWAQEKALPLFPLYTIPRAQIGALKARTLGGCVILAVVSASLVAPSALALVASCPAQLLSNLS